MKTPRQMKIPAERTSEMNDAEVIKMEKGSR
jgi:hypothetical protein